MKFLISADRDMYDDEMAELRAGIGDWWKDPDRAFGIVNRGIHVTMIREDGTVVRLCHHDEPATDVGDTAVFAKVAA